jgi:hypothetical protein
MNAHSRGAIVHQIELRERYCEEWNRMRRKGCMKTSDGRTTDRKKLTHENVFKCMNFNFSSFFLSCRRGVFRIQEFLFKKKKKMMMRTNIFFSVTSVHEQWNVRRHKITSTQELANGLKRRIHLSKRCELIDDDGEVVENVIESAEGLRDDAELDLWRVQNGWRFLWWWNLKRSSPWLSNRDARIRIRVIKLRR